MKYFTINELCKSDTASKLKIDNTPNEQIISNLTKLVDNILDPLREAYGRPIYVNSGYRCLELNKAVAGSKTSSHMTGEAADITTGTKLRNLIIFNLVKRLNLPFDLLIWEKGGQWIHVSYTNRNRRLILYLG